VPSVLQPPNPGTYTSHQPRYLCDSCHTSELTGLPPATWLAPKDLDWTGMDARQTCLFVKRGLGVDRGDSGKLLRHLLGDSRIRWALENGIRPDGPQPTVPGGYAEWKQEVEAWEKDGMLCE
jgi:hypothetical protein